MRTKTAPEIQIGIRTAVSKVTAAVREKIEAATRPPPPYRLRSFEQNQPKIER
jgi:hypothetical protein